MTKAYGNVWVFNCFNEAATLTVASYPAGTIPAWTASGPSIYQPSAISVPRVKHSDDQPGPAFSNDGKNELSVTWDSAQYQSVSMPIPAGDISIDNDLVLYLTLNQFILMDTDGFVLATVPVGEKRST